MQHVGGELGSATAVGSESYTAREVLDRIEVSDGLLLQASRGCVFWRKRAEPAVIESGFIVSSRSRFHWGASFDGARTAETLSKRRLGDTFGELDPP